MTEKDMGSTFHQHVDALGLMIKAYGKQRGGLSVAVGFALILIGGEIVSFCTKQVMREGGAEDTRVFTYGTSKRILSQALEDEHLWDDEPKGVVH